MTATILRKIVDGLLRKSKEPINDHGVRQNNPVDAASPSSYHDDAMTRRDIKMKNITISEDDSRQIWSILTTHAEMQDNRTIESMSLLARLKRDEPKDAAEMIIDLGKQVEDFEADCENLKRIAQLFN